MTIFFITYLICFFLNPYLMGRIDNFFEEDEYDEPLDSTLIIYSLLGQIGFIMICFAVIFHLISESKVLNLLRILYSKKK